MPKLYEFVKNKMNNQSEVNTRIRNNFQKYSSQNKNLKDSMNVSQKSLGFSTLLDIQNNEQMFSNLQLSKINVRKTQRIQKQFLGNTINSKNEIEQMRRKRQNLQKKVYKTFKSHQRQKQLRNYILESQKQGTKLRKIDDNSNNIHSKLSQQQDLFSDKLSSSIKKSIFTNEQNQSILSQSKHAYISNNSSCMKNKYSKQSISDIQIRNRNAKKDKFVDYLIKDMIQLRIQRFNKCIHNFKYKWLLKCLNIYIQLRKMDKKYKKNLCRMVFIDWKRYSKQQLKHNFMIQMIRERIQKKRKQNKCTKAIIQNDISEKKNNVKNNFHEIYLQKSHISNTQEIYDHQQSVEQQAVSAFSQIHLKQISPIKPLKKEIHKGQKINKNNKEKYFRKYEQEDSDSQQNDYDKYSCYTDHLQ